MRILVTFALDREFAPWKRLRPFDCVERSHFCTYQAKLDQTVVRVALTGVGPVHAKRVAASALLWRPDLCISSGLAGSLRAVHRVGEVFVAREVMELESGRTIGADQDFLSAALKHDVRIVERLLSSSAMIVTVEGKARLGRMAEAVEMESFTVLSEAAERKIPAVAMRAISDSADEDLAMDFTSVLDPAGEIDRSKAFRALVGMPLKLPAVMRLERNSRLAAKRLAEFLDAYVGNIMNAHHTTEMAGASR